MSIQNLPNRTSKDLMKEKRQEADDIQKKLLQMQTTQMI